MIGLRRYTEAKRWQQLEYLAKEMDRFFNIRQVQNALSMLDYNSRPVLLFPEAESDPGRHAFVTDDIIMEALDIDSQKSFDHVQLAIRDTFDRFFIELCRLHAHIETGLLRRADLKPYLSYWLILMKTGRDRKSTEFLKRLHDFLKHFCYDGAIDLIDQSEKCAPPGVMRRPGLVRKSQRYPG